MPARKHRLVKRANSEIKHGSSGRALRKVARRRVRKAPKAIKSRVYKDRRTRR